MEHRFYFDCVGCSVAYNRCTAEVVYMIWSSDLIKHKIPVDPVVHTVVQIANDVMRVLFCMAQGIPGRRTVVRQFYASLTVHQHQIRVIFSYHREGVKMIA